MYLGQHLADLKAKNRLPLPSAFQRASADKFYATQGFDRNVLILPRRAFELLYQQFAALNIADPQARLLLRMFLSTASLLEAAPDGNLQLPGDLVRFADLHERVVLVGQGDYFELWSPAEWEEQQVELRDYRANAQRFSAFTIATR